MGEDGKRKKTWRLLWHLLQFHSKNFGLNFDRKFFKENLQSKKNKSYAQRVCAEIVERKKTTVSVQLFHENTLRKEFTVSGPMATKLFEKKAPTSVQGRRNSLRKKATTSVQGRRSSLRKKKLQFRSKETKLFEKKKLVPLKEFWLKVPEPKKWKEREKSYKTKLFEKIGKMWKKEREREREKKGKGVKRRKKQRKRRKKKKKVDSKDDGRREAIDNRKMRFKIIGSESMNHAGDCVVTRSFRLLFADPLLDEILSSADSIGKTRDSHYTVPGTRRKHALLRDLNVGAT